MDTLFDHSRNRQISGKFLHSIFRVIFSRFPFQSPLSLQMLRMNPIFRGILKAGRPLQTMLPSSSQFALPSFTSPIFLQTTRGFAAAAPKKGKKPAAAPVEEKKKSDSLIPINIFVGRNSTFILIRRWKGPRGSSWWPISWLVVAHACIFRFCSWNIGPQSEFGWMGNETIQRRHWKGYDRVGVMVYYDCIVSFVWRLPVVLKSIICQRQSDLVFWFEFFVE